MTVHDIPFAPIARGPLFRVTAYCGQSGCRCLDRRGILLYWGESRKEAEEALDLVPTGYEVEIEEVVP